MLDKGKLIRWLGNMQDSLSDSEAYRRVYQEIAAGTFDAPLTEESQEQHSSLADSRMMTITKFAWDEKVEQVRQLREENERLKEIDEL